VSGGELNESARKFFGAKAWALLHDPPHKMWSLRGTVRIAAGGHEAEAREIWRKLGLEEVFGGPEEYRELVHDADDMACTSDRWITNFTFASVQASFEYSRLHNIFNPRFSAEIRDLRGQELVGFINALAGKLAKYRGDPRTTYHALYSLYEVEWAARGLPPSLADTRAPTHTLFDHVYATALTLNLLWPDRKVGGYAAMVDIPGIQQIVRYARKTGDFWAGSWLVSMLTWLTLLPFVWELGADVLLKPSPRFNPYYHALVWAQLGGGDELEKDFARLYASLYPQLPATALGFKELLSYPVIPGTACLLVPKELPGSGKVSESSLEDRLKKAYEKAYEVVERLLLGERQSLEEPYRTFFLNVLREGEGGGLAVKLYRLIRRSEPRAFEKLLRPRIVVVDVGTLYGEWLRVVEGGEGTGLRSETANILRALVAVKEKLAGRLGIGEKELAKRLTWQALFALLYYELSLRASRKIVPPKAWFTLEDGELKPIAEFEKFYDSGGVGYLTCSLCGAEPAILRLGKSVVAPRVIEYTERAQKMVEQLLKLLGEPSILKEQLKISVKPGEALGPLCLTKRALYEYLKDSLEFKFDSTEDVAFDLLKQEGLAGIAKHLRALGGEAEKVANYIEGKPFNVMSFDVALDANAEKARSIYESSLKQLFRERAARDPSVREIVQQEVRRVSSKLGQVYEVAGLQLPEDFFTSFRSYYFILRADADSIGELSKGRIPVGSYVELLDRLGEEAEKRGGREIGKAFRGAREYVRLLAEELRKELSSAQEGGDARQREGGIMLPSPTYSLALSTVLMVTALRDVMTVRHMLNGAPVFSGGDDDLALLPIETGLAAVDILRGLYHGENGFHRIGDYFIPAPVVYGKSFSLRVANILDLMSDEIAESARLLDEVAKKAVWSHSAGETKKDSLVLSDSRSGAVALLPLGDGHRALKALELMWLSRLCGFLSANLPEDFQRLSDAVERAAETGSWDTALKLLGYTLERNVSRDPRGKDLLDGLQRLLEELAQQGWRSHGNSERRSALSRLVESFQVVRGYP